MKPTDEKKRKKLDPDDEVHARNQIRDFVNGTVITIVMALVTLFALVADDLRTWITTRKDDLYFDIGMILSFFLFGLELLVKSCVEDDFKYSFFFWLDFIATLSLIPDIPWLTDLLNMIMGIKLSRYGVDVLPGSP